jgi:hypothetical protein
MSAHRSKQIESTPSLAIQIDWKIQVQHNGIKALRSPKMPSKG